MVYQSKSLEKPILRSKSDHLGTSSLIQKLDFIEEPSRPAPEVNELNGVAQPSLKRISAARSVFDDSDSDSSDDSKDSGYHSSEEYWFSR